MRLVTLLSIIGSNGIAVPLSSGFPSSELRYILGNSGGRLWNQISINYWKI